MIDTTSRRRAADDGCARFGRVPEVGTTAVTVSSKMADRQVVPRVTAIRRKTKVRP